MLVIMKIINEEDFPDQIYLSEEKLEVSNEGNKILIDTDTEKRFSTLCSLFALKEDWKSETNLEAKYQIYFQDENSQQLFLFSDELPDNFITFMTYISRIVGDHYE